MARPRAARKNRGLMFGVDVGGTFTDVVLFDPETGRIAAGKVPSTPANQAEGFGNGLESLGVDLGRVVRGLHGTTVATNAAIERKGARTLGVFTKGFRDVIAIGTGQRFTGGLFDPRFRKPQPLIPRSLRLEIDERMSHRGEPITAPDAVELSNIVGAVRECDAEAVAVCFLHSYANDAHERHAVEFLKTRLPERFVCGSAEVLPQIREFERFTTTTFNAYLGPVMARYLGRLGRWLHEKGARHDLLIMTNNGGVASAEQAARFPVTAVLSGPAGGVAAGLFLASQMGIDDFITYDMGGTSTDVCLVRNRRPVMARQRIVSGLPLKIPQLDINTVGAGGGSIGWIGRDGAFAVGPQSAGAVPGPACYGAGGRDATVTDANLVLNRIGPETRLAGFMALRKDLAEAAVAGIADRLGATDLNFVAEGILRIVESNMSGAIREISVERGEDPRSFTLFAFGGAGPMHGCAVAQEVGIRRVVSPNYPGNFSALGLLTSDLRHELVRTHLTLLDDADMAAVAGRLAEMVNEAHAVLADEGIGRADREILCSLGIRYEGQAHELDVPAAPGSLDRDAIARAFTERYYRTWSYSPTGRPLQLVTLRVTAVGRAPKPAFPRLDARVRRLEQAEIGRRGVHFAGAARETRVYRRSLLPPEAVLGGPAIIEEEGSTTVVFPDWEARVDDVGNIIIEAR
ncbi:MAG: hydantoinase/oxoprolinase family protein [Proteobacteria bacterium]|nr:hydantoinase/oxoprolinase family protein [Pseudomonadota bacterium]